MFPGSLQGNTREQPQRDGDSSSFGSAYFALSLTAKNLMPRNEIETRETAESQLRRV